MVSGGLNVYAYSQQVFKKLMDKKLGFGKLKMKHVTNKLKLC